SGSAASGTAAFTKIGGGVLILTGANTFSGGGTSTPGQGGGVVVNNGTLIVNSFGANGPLGALSNPTVAGADFANKVVIGGAGNSPVLTYMGQGETLNRIIEIVGTGGTSPIESDGSGPLILTSVVMSQTANKTFNLRGNNADRNEVTAVLTNGPTVGGT